MNIRDIRMGFGDTQSEFATRYHIPFRTIQNWEAGVRKPPRYLLELLESQVAEDMAHRRTKALPIYDRGKRSLPRRREFVGAISWLKAVQECINRPVVFALDQALMCEGTFGGRMDEDIIWMYGDDSVSEFNGVVVLGNHISRYCVDSSRGLEYTCFNRTISDALANESILDMQGITEALSRYYYANGESFRGVAVPAKYQDRFERLAIDAIGYYDG